MSNNIKQIADRTASVFDNLENNLSGKASFLTVIDLAEYLRVSPKTIRNWVLHKEIPYFKVGRLVRFQQEEVMKWILERRNTYGN